MCPSKPIRICSRSPGFLAVRGLGRTPGLVWRFLPRSRQERAGTLSAKAFHDERQKPVRGAYTGSVMSKKTDLGFSYSSRGEVTDTYESTANSGGYLRSRPTAAATTSFTTSIPRYWRPTTMLSVITGTLSKQIQPIACNFSSSKRLLLLALFAASAVAVPPTFYARRDYGNGGGCGGEFELAIGDINGDGIQVCSVHIQMGLHLVDLSIPVNSQRTSSVTHQDRKFLPPASF